MVGGAFLRRYHSNQNLNQGINYMAIWGTQGQDQHRERPRSRKVLASLRNSKKGRVAEAKKNPKKPKNWGRDQELRPAGAPGEGADFGVGSG